MAASRPSQPHSLNPNMIDCDDFWLHVSWIYHRAVGHMFQTTNWEHGKEQLKRWAKLQHQQAPGTKYATMAAQDSSVRLSTWHLAIEFYPAEMDALLRRHTDKKFPLEGSVTVPEHTRPSPEDHAKHEDEQGERRKYLERVEKGTDGPSLPRDRGADMRII
ncbi:MAG: hypothetical protein Q9162_005933 [Coniocarpon cinnabarinum]